MTKETYSNFAFSPLVADIDADDTELVIVSASDFPASGPFRLFIDKEVMLCTAIVGETLTVTRGYEDSTATDHTAGSMVIHGITVGALENLFTDGMKFKPRRAAIERLLDERIMDRVHVDDFGAIGDGASHPLSSIMLEDGVTPKYPDLATAQVDYPTATALSNEVDRLAIQTAIDFIMPNGKKPFRILFSDKTYMIDKMIDCSRGFIHFEGQGTSSSNTRGTVLRRTKEVILLGTSASGAVSPSFTLVSRVSMDNMQFDGGDSFQGGDPLNGNAHYLSPMIKFVTAYEFYFTNCAFHNCAGSWMECIEMWDSRFINCRWTFGGSTDGARPALWMRSIYGTWTSATKTIGERVKNTAGTHLFEVSAVTTGTPGGSEPSWNTTTNATTTDGGVTWKCLGAYPTFDITCNNNYFWGNRFESCPGLVTYLDGNNGVDFWFTNCKWESVFYQMDYLVKMNSASCTTFHDCWMYVTGSDFRSLVWDSSSSNTLSASVAKTFILTTAPAFNRMYNTVPVAVYDAANPYNVMYGRVTSWDSTTRTMVFQPDYVDPAADLVSTISAWKVIPIHPGLIYASSSRFIKGRIFGGNIAATPPTGGITMRCFVHLNNCEAADFDINLLGGTALLPGAAFQALHDTTKVWTPAAGTVTFNVAETTRVIADDTPVMLFGQGYGTANSWAYGHVLSCPGDGTCQVRVDPGQFSGASATGWVITEKVTSPYLVTNPPSFEDNKNIQMKLTGSSYHTYGATSNYNMAPIPRKEEYLSCSRLGSPRTSYRNYLTMLKVYVGEILDSVVTIGGNKYNAGKFVFRIYDYITAAFVDYFEIDGFRNFNWLKPQRFIGMDDTSKQSRIVGAYTTPPTNPSGEFLNGDIIFNCDPASAESVGWVMVDEAQTDATGWKAFGTIA